MPLLTLIPNPSVSQKIYFVEPVKINRLKNDIIIILHIDWERWRIIFCPASCNFCVLTPCRFREAIAEGAVEVGAEAGQAAAHGIASPPGHRGATCKIPPVGPMLDGRECVPKEDWRNFGSDRGPLHLSRANFTPMAQGTEIVLRPRTCRVTRSRHRARPFPAFLAKLGFRDTPPFRSDQGR